MKQVIMKKNNKNKIGRESYTLDKMIACVFYNAV
jgi:hypothetical protein